MDKEFLKLGDAEIEKWRFHFSKSPTTMEDIKVYKILISKDFPYEELEKKGRKRISSTSSAAKMMKKLNHQSPKNERISKRLQRK